MTICSATDDNGPLPPNFYPPGLPADPVPFCADDQEDAVEQCGSWGILLQFPEAGYDSYIAHTVACGNLLEPDGCTYWAPGNHVEQNPTSGVYEIDAAFVDALTADPSGLIDCDTGRFAFTDPGFVLTNGSAGELAYELGFLNGDVPTEVNGYDVETLGEVVLAYLKLLYAGETEFTVLVNRPGVGPISIEIEIVS